MKYKLFFLTVFTLLSFRSLAQTVANPVPDLTVCMSTYFDLTTQIPIALGGQSPNEYIVEFYETENDAIYQANAIPNPENYTPVVVVPQITIRVTNATDDTYAITTFNLNWIDVDVSASNLAVCTSYTLPVLTAGSYYTGPNAAGAVVPAGTVITSTQMLYVYNQIGACTDQAAFTITILSEGNNLVLQPLTGCDYNFDGIATFDLTQVLSQIYGAYGYENVQALFYSTQQELAEGFPFLSNLTNYVSASSTVYIAVNVEGCSVTLELPLVVNPCIENTISGYVTFNPDGGDCNASTTPMAYVPVYYSLNNTIVGYAYTNNNGYYIFNNVPDGNATVSISESYANMNTSPQNYTLTFPGNYDDTNFCLSQTVPTHDVQVNIIPYSNNVPGFLASYTIIYQNIGSFAESGSVSLQFDSSNLTFSSATSPVTQSGNSIALNYTNLQPFEMRQFTVSFLVSTTAVVGETLIYTANITSLVIDANTANNTSVLNMAIQSSYDPNDIIVHEGEFISLDQADDYLHYTIRFQNTGTANATFVRLATTLNSNLDLDTFEPVAGSHSFQANRTGNDIEFIFDDIQLPFESANEPGSHGYVTYRIKPKATVAIGDVITGQASIFFDYNPAVPTNTATTTIQATAGNKDIAANSFIIYPNPASGRVILQMQNVAESASVTITDVLGKTVQTAAISGTQASLDVSALKAGVYFVSLNANGKLAAKKLVIK